MDDKTKQAKKILENVVYKRLPVMLSWGCWQIIPHNGDKKSITEYDNLIHHVKHKWDGQLGTPPFKM
jgi:hypothetical protein